MNFDFSFITRMISPSKGIGLLKAGIEAIVKEQVEHFEITYINQSEQIYFKVWLKAGVMTQPYTGDNKALIIFAVKNLAKMNFKDDETLDIVKCERLETGKINLDVFTTKDGEKIKHSIIDHGPETPIDNSKLKL